MMVDTGATGVVERMPDASASTRSHLDPRPGHRPRMEIVPVAPIVLDKVAVGEISVRDVPALCIPTAVFRQVLGMSSFSNSRNLR